MRKKIIALSAVAAFATASFGNDADIAAQLDALKAQIQALETKMAESEKKLKKVEKTAKKNTGKISEVKILANNDNIKWDVDFRTAIDYIKYKRADGSETENKDLMSSKLKLGMGYAASDNMVFKGALQYHKLFGANPPDNTTGMPQRGFGYDSFDWVSNETASNDNLKVKEAYWLYMNDTFFGADIPWTASIGRRPSTDGFIVNMRDDTPAQSPIGHAINMEFDGGSFKFNLDKLTGVQGMYWKLCVGRGLTNAVSRFDMSGGLTSNGDYSSSENSLSDIDMKGFIFVPYNDGQYSVETTYFIGTNLPGFHMLDTPYLNGSTTNTGMLKLVDSDNNNKADSWAFNDSGDLSMKGLGDMSGAAVSFKADGIGRGLGDFLDNTTFFASWAQSQTNPDNNTQVLDLQGMMSYLQANNMTFEQGLTAFAGMTPVQQAAFFKGAGMLGSDKKETGSSIYAGIQMPCLLTEDGRIGIEWNKGDKYWRSFTYGEDTMVGSKLATRGTAWEVYYTKPLMKALSMQVRYTHMKYDYTGSQGFFGDEGTPMTMAEAQAFGLNPIEEATDIRAYIRYRF
jgi:hypothetical protein